MSFSPILIRIAELILVAILASIFKSAAVAILGGLFLGALWSYTDRQDS